MTVFKSRERDSAVLMAYGESVDMLVKTVSIMKSRILELEAQIAQVPNPKQTVEKEGK